MGQVTPQQIAQALDLGREFALESRAHLWGERRAFLGAAIELPKLPVHVAQRGKDRAWQPPPDGDRRGAHQRVVQQSPERGMLNGLVGLNHLEVSFDPGCIDAQELERPAVHRADVGGEIVIDDYVHLLAAKGVQIAPELLRITGRFPIDQGLREICLARNAPAGTAFIVGCIELGAEDYIAKPFNPVFLRARIGAALEKKRLRDREVSYLRQIQEQKQRSEDLLRIILPPDVADELTATNMVQPRRFESVGVLFCDLVGFTAYCDQHPPEEILEQLQLVVEAFEALAAAHGLEKIKTIGDAFMATAGLRTPLPNPAWNCVRCAGDMIVAARRLPPHWQVRIGLHVGPVVAGVVGRRKYQYDVWGDTVNLAARMQEAAQPGSICVPAETWRLLQGQCPAIPLGLTDIRGKGRLELFRIEPDAAAGFADGG